MANQIHLDVPGSTAEQREVGIRQALCILAAGGIDPQEAQLANKAYEIWNAAGRPAGEITFRQIEAAAVFRLARLSAIEACEGESQFASGACCFEILPSALH